MAEVKVKLVKKIDDSYKILIQKDSVNKVPAFLKKNKLGEKYMIVTDSKVRKLYGNSLLRFLKKNGLKADIISFPQGEKNKTLKSVEKLANEMVEKGDVVAVMEAMKMEVQVTAHRSGQIKQLAQIHQNYSNDEKIAEIHAV